MPTVDYLPVATGAGALVDSQANFLGSGYQEEGFQVGIAQPSEVNKVLRQSSMIANAVATFISNTLNIAILDDGNSPALITYLTNAIAAAAGAAGNPLTVVTYSATPVFNCNLGTTFQITLTGNVTSYTVTNLAPGDRIKLIIKQDGTGGHTFPAGAFPLGAVNTGANKVSIQNFIVDASSNIYVDGPLIVQ